MILTVSSISDEGQTVLGSWHVAEGSRIQIQRDEVEYPDRSTYRSAGRRELIQLPPPDYGEAER